MKTTYELRAQSAIKAIDYLSIGKEWKDELKVLLAYGMQMEEERNHYREHIELISERSLGL